MEQGFLTGKYEWGSDGRAVGPEGSRGDLQAWSDFEERQCRVLEAVRDVAGEADGTPAQVELRWLIDRERFTCVPITAARTVEQLEESVGAVEVELSVDHRERIADAYE